MTQENKSDRDLIGRIKDYWNRQVHDVHVSSHPVGTPGFFDDLDDYRFGKNRYLLEMVDFAAYRGKTVLELACGVGTDLVRFARAGAEVTGIDLSDTAIDLARKNFELRGLRADLRVMNGEELDLPDGAFDLVYAHGALQYTAEPRRMADEAWRVLRPGGELNAQFYNRKGWIVFMSKAAKVPLEHRDAPAFHLHTVPEVKRMLGRFSKLKVVPTRFPVKSRIHKGLKGVLFNTLFVNFFRVVPKPLVRRWGGHIMAFAVK